MHWIYLINELHNVSWITVINELFHDILIYWDAPICMYTVGIYYVHINAHAFSIYLENMYTIIHLCESDVTCGQVWWPKLEISAHTQQWTHTHTQSSGQPFMLPCRGAVGGSVPCSRAPKSWYWGWRKCWTFTPPPTIPAGPETQTRNLLLTSPTL